MAEKDYHTDDGPGKQPKRKPVNLYPTTHSNLRLLAAMRNEAMIDTVDVLVADALEAARGNL